MDPEYFVPLPGAAPPPAPLPVDGEVAGPAGAARKQAQKAVKRPASTPCMITPNTLREAFGKDKLALRQAKFLGYPDVPVCFFLYAISVHCHVATLTAFPDPSFIHQRHHVHAHVPVILTVCHGEL